ncbi:hypothetical protein KY290_020987 [Solanum tuberosum]|uniref:Retrotransposon gag protein n=1 Tax=Solanum tuberosum TaxID=4113 RepID=A0ABQ7V1T4_SOLTU|nr:hypothetical protein KY289_020174 [Solanum tuberosum]KAH0692837.1 hypothetical protein KY285_019934 [Solanum tuberosum]KAH0757494.1 hypothetical protein KY290_020987 [Solanum tuberosum]
MKITGEDQLEEVDEVNAVIGDNPQENDLAEISFHAILGQSVGATMKLQGEINGKKVLIFVESGSTHNFVVDSIVEEHNILVEMVPTFGVQIGNGDIIRCNKVCRNLQIQLTGFTITQDYYPFAIGGADVVFGIKWLASLNTIQANWKDMLIIFNWQGKRYKLQCVRSTDSATATLQSFNMVSEVLGNAIQTLLHEFKFVFSEPTYLPPLEHILMLSLCY